MKERFREARRICGMEESEDWGGRVGQGDRYLRTKGRRWIWEGEGLLEWSANKGMTRGV